MSSSHPVQPDVRKRKRGDRSPFVIVLQDQARVPFDVTTWTSWVLQYNNGVDYVTLTPSILDGPNGKITATPAAADVDYEGPFDLEVKCVDGAGLPRRFPQGYADDAPAFFPLYFEPNADPPA